MHFLSCNGNKFTRLFTAHLVTCCAKKSFRERNFFWDPRFNSLVFFSGLLCCTVQIFFVITFLIIFFMGGEMSPHFWLDEQNLILVNPPYFLLQGAIRFNGAVILTFLTQTDNQFLIDRLGAYCGLEDPLNHVHNYTGIASLWFTFWVFIFKELAWVS